MSKFLKNTLARKKVMASSTISVVSAPHITVKAYPTFRKHEKQNRTKSNRKTLIWNRSWSLDVALERKKRTPTSSTHSIFIHKTRVINLSIDNNNDSNHFSIGNQKLKTPKILNKHEFNWIEFRTMTIVATIRTRIAQKISIATPSVSVNEGREINSSM